MWLIIKDGKIIKWINLTCQEAVIFSERFFVIIDPFPVNGELATQWLTWLGNNFCARKYQGTCMCHILSNLSHILITNQHLPFPYVISLPCPVLIIFAWSNIWENESSWYLSHLTQFVFASLFTNNIRPYIIDGYLYFFISNSFFRIYYSFNVVIYEIIPKASISKPSLLFNVYFCKWWTVEVFFGNLSWCCNLCNFLSLDFNHSLPFSLWVSFNCFFLMDKNLFVSFDAVWGYHKNCWHVLYFNISLITVTSNTWVKFCFIKIVVPKFHCF